MSFNTTETIQRLWETFLREQLAALPPEERQQYEQQFEDRFGDLLKNAANGAPGGDGFLDLIGFGGKGPVEFGEMNYPYIQPDFDDSVVPSQLHAVAELYYIYQHERMKIFQVVDVLLRLFHLGKMRIQRGPGARGLYLLEKWQPLRYTVRHRAGAVWCGGQPQFPSATGRLHGGLVAIFPRFVDRRSDPRRTGHRTASVRLGRHGAAHRPGFALRPGPLNLRQCFLADDGNRALPEAGTAIAGCARH